VPRRKASTISRRGAQPGAQQTLHHKVKTILSQRDRLIAEIGFLRERGAGSKFIDNAQQLLTRWWSTANWNAREDLLRTADWLVRLGKRERQDGRSLCVNVAPEKRGDHHGQSTRNPADPRARARNRVDPTARR
jgi:hypothetical protein